MNSAQRTFLETLLEATGPSGFETDVTDSWVDYVSQYADSVERDAYGNAVAVYNEDADTSIAIGGHADEIGFMVRQITGDGFLKLARVGGSDNTVSQGQRVSIHTDDGVVRGVIGQTAIHLRERGDNSVPDIAEQHVDIGAEDEDEAREHVSVGDPITVDVGLDELIGSRLIGRAMDNRVGIWVAAEVLRQAVEENLDITVYAVATVQEELGLRGAQMVGYDLDPDAFVAVDVTHATDTPGVPPDSSTEVELGGGPTVARGSASHPVLVEAARDAADATNTSYTFEAAGRRTGTDSDAVYVSKGGIPSLRVGIPNRYMHTPVEVIDTEDLEDTVTLLTELAANADSLSFVGT